MEILIKLRRVKTKDPKAPASCFEKAAERISGSKRES